MLTATITIYFYNNDRFCMDVVANSYDDLLDTVADIEKINYNFATTYCHIHQN